MDVHEDTTDREWLIALREGDPSALRRIFDRHYPLLVADLNRFLPDQDSCRDMAQEVLVDLWKKRESLDVHSSLRAYLRRAAVNRALNHIRQQQRLQLGGLEYMEENTDAADDPGRALEQEALEQRLHTAIEALPERCRIVFSLSRFEQLSHREIADQLGISTKTIENQITKAMRLLRQALLKGGDLSSIVISLINWWFMG